VPTGIIPQGGFRREGWRYARAKHRLWDHALASLLRDAAQPARRKRA
jgi:hypothetical protein